MEQVGICVERNADERSQVASGAESPRKLEQWEG